MKIINVGYNPFFFIFVCRNCRFIANRSIVIETDIIHQVSNRVFLFLVLIFNVSNFIWLEVF